MQDQLTLWPTAKRCSKCGETKPLSAFHRRNTEGRAGYRSHCKACQAAKPRKRRSRAGTMAKPCPLCGRPKGLGQRRHLCDTCREGISARKVAYALAWQKAHPDAVKAIHRRKAHRRRLRRQDAFVEDVDPLVLLERDDGACGICGADVDPLNFHVDHIVPLARGGEHSYANAQVAHPACNARKGARLLTP
jgi:hypothetical protein